MKGIILSLLVLGLSLIACEGNVLKKRKISKIPAYHPFLFHNGYIGDLEFPGHSFPYLFNDSLVKLLGIQQISQSFFEQGDAEMITDSLTPYKKIVYRFLPDGKLQSIEQKDFFDQRLINHYLLKYDQKDKDGERIHFKTFEHTEEGNSFHTYKLVRSDNEWSCYQNESNLHLYFVIHNEKLQKPLAVDSLCQPDEDDWIIFGTLNHPIKRYHVENIVEETDVYQYHYQNNTLVKEEWVDAPFNNKRSMLFKDGNLTGYVDSVFSAGEYISMMEHGYGFENGLPVKLEHKKEVGDTLKTLRWEQFEYIHYQE